MRATVAIVVVLLSACATAGGYPPPGVGPLGPASTEIPPQASSSPVRGQPPIAAGAVPEAGVIFVRGADDWIYRYDGVTGQLTRATRHAAIQLASAEGAYAGGLEGGLELLRWDGRIESIDCGPGRFELIGPGGACLSQDPGRTVWIRLRGESSARVFLPPEWAAGSLAWSPDGRHIAALRSAPGPTPEERAHNALWLVDVGGNERRLYEPAASQAFVVGPGWSPDGRWLTLWELPIVSNSVAADGGRLLLVDTTSGAIVDLGTALVCPGWIRWSADGRLAYVRGGDRQTWIGKTLVVRSSDGSEVTLTDADGVGLAPAWSRRPDGAVRLTWVEGEAGNGNGGVYVAGTGPGARYLVESDLRVASRRLPFPGIVEGVRPSADGRVSLVLVRRPSPPGRDEYGALELWLMKPPGGGSATQVPLLSGLGDLAFGFYGRQPALFDLVAWSLDPR